MRRVLLARSKGLAGSLLALAILAAGGLQAATADQMEGPRVGLGGYCPVCILDANKWAKGSPEHQATYDGVTYYFPEEAIKEKFLASPAKYVPALGGDCIVCYAKLGKRVPGMINHTARYNDRLFLFPGAEQQRAFVANPQEFADADLALKGDCAVCLVHHNKRVAGKPEFAEIKDGFRYLFPSAREQAAFREDPAAYVAPASRPNAMESKMGRPVKGDQMEGPRVGLGGYCPVCILDANKWAKGSPEHQATYDGVTYYFPEEAIKEKFLASPAKYVPALGGDCIVCYAKLGKRVPGMINHTARYNDRLFLFPGAEQQRAFVANPQEFADADLALKGMCGLPGPPQQAGRRQARVRRDQGRAPLPVPVGPRAGRLPRGPGRLRLAGSHAGCHGAEDEPTTRGQRLADGHGEDDVRSLRVRSRDDPRS